MSMTGLTEASRRARVRIISALTPLISAALSGGYSRIFALSSSNPLQRDCTYSLS